MKRLNTMIQLAALSALFACCALAADSKEAVLPNQPFAPGPESQKLAVWYGDWTYEMELVATPLWPAAKSAGNLTGRSLLNGFAAEFVFRDRSMPAEMQAQEIDWFDPLKKRFGYVYLSNDGVPEQGTFAFSSGSRWTWEGSFVTKDKLWHVRGIGTISTDGKAFTQTGEMSADGVTWIPAFTKKATKVRDLSVAPATVEQELIKLENEWAKAYLTRDVQALGRIEADEWICTTADGTVLSKKDDIGDIASGAFVATVFDMADLKVQVYGDTAVVTGRQTEKATYKGKDASAVHRITDVWLRRDGRWQAIASHLSFEAKK